MKYAKLGQTGLIVSQLALGTWTFSKTRNDLKSVYKVDAEIGPQLIHQALDAGVNFFDTADRYAMGEAEGILADALGPRRKEVVIATKGGLRASDALIDVGLSRRHLFNAIENSLRRLKSDWVDIYIAHREDEVTPLEETLVALDDIVRSGKARYIGFSNWTPWKVAAAMEFQRANGLAQFTHGQMYYSLIGRDIEGDYLRMSAHYGLGLTVWSPLAMGLLSGKYTRESLKAPGTRFSEIGVLPLDMEPMFKTIDALQALAARRQTTPARIALAWLLAKPAVSSLVIGVTRPDQLSENLAAIDLTLSDEDIAVLDALAPPPAPYPLWHVRSVRDPATSAAIGVPRIFGKDA